MAATRVLGVGRPRAAHLLGVLAFALVALLLLPSFRQGWAHARATFRSPAPDDALEGTLILEAELVRRGEALYRPIVPDEFVSAPYTPVHPIILAALPTRADIPFTAGRALSLLAIASVGAGIGIFVGYHTGLWWLGGIAALLWLAFAPVQLWALRVKPDPLALAFTTGGLLLASIRRGRFADWAALLFALAFMTKQTAVIAPAAVGLNLLFTDWRRGIRFGLFYVLAAGAPYLALHLATDGWATAHIWGLHQRAWWQWALLAKYLRLMAWSLPLAGVTLLALPVARRDFAYRQALIYALMAPATLYGAGEQGAHHNHLLETMLAWTMGGGIAAGLALRAWPGGTMWRAAGIAALAGLLLQAGLMRTTPEWYRGEFSPPSLERFVRYVQSKPGEVLADNVGLLAAAGKQVRFDDPSTMGPTIKTGTWDPSVLHTMIARREFELIMLDVDLRKEKTDPTGRWADQTLQLIDQHYQLQYADVVHSYIPRQ